MATDGLNKLESGLELIAKECNLLAPDEKPTFKDKHPKLYDIGCKIRDSDVTLLALPTGTWAAVFYAASKIPETYYYTWWLIPASLFGALKMNFSKPIKMYTTD